MKKFIYFIATGFFLQASLTTAAFAETPKPAAPVAVPQSEQVGEMAGQYGLSSETSKTRFAEILKMRQEKPYSSLFVPESACAGKEKELAEFINEVPKTDGNGNEIAEKTKGSLFEKELELGERNFDFEKLQDARFNRQNDNRTRACLDVFAGAAISEWADYFEKRSQQFECGLKFERKDEQSPLEVIDVSGAKTDTCDIPYGKGKLYDFYKAQMDKLKDIVNSFDKKSSDEARKMNEASGDPSKTQAKVGCNGPDCNPSSAEARTAKSLEKFSAEWCCDRIGERFEVLGFTTMKDVKPNERVCKELHDKEGEDSYCEGSFCTKTIGDCLKNFASVFLRDFFKSFVSSFDILGWGSQLMTMVREIISNPGEAAMNIVKNMFGFDGDYMGCLNKKSQAQYACQMIGKFAGSSAGFSAGLGGIIGLARGTFVGVAGKLAKDPAAKIIKPALKEAAKSGARAAAVGTVWPYYAVRGVFKGTTSGVKGTWKHTPIILGKTTKAVISAGPEVSGRVMQGAGRVLFRGNSPEMLRARAMMDEAAAPQLQRAKDIRASGGKPAAAAETTAAKYDAQVKQVEAAVKSIDDEIAALEKRRIELTNGKRMRNGAPSFGKDGKAAAEYESATAKIDDLKKSKSEADSAMEALRKEKAAELEKITAAGTAASNKIRQNVKSIVVGTGAAGSVYPNSQKNKDKKTGATTPAAGSGGPKIAPPAQGVGTGEGIPGASAAPKADAAKPAEAGKPAPTAPAPVSGASEKGSDGAAPAPPPGFDE